MIICFYNTRHSSQAKTIIICTCFNLTQVLKSIMGPTWKKTMNYL